MEQGNKVSEFDPSEEFGVTLINHFYWKSFQFSFITLIVRLQQLFWA